MKYSKEILNMLGLKFFEEFRLNIDVSQILYIDEQFRLWGRSAIDEKAIPKLSTYSLITVLTNPLVQVIKEEDVQKELEIIKQELLKKT